MSQDQATPFSSGGLPPSPQCEHGVEQRWCNNGRASDGRMCADIQVALDLQRYQTGERVLCSECFDLPVGQVRVAVARLLEDDRALCMECLRRMTMAAEYPHSDVVATKEATSGR